MRFIRDARTVILAAAVMLGACGGDSNDPTPFDPAAMSDDFDAAVGTYGVIFDSELGQNFELVAYELGSMTGGGPVVTIAASALASAIEGGRPVSDASVATAVKSLLRTRTTVSGAAVILPSELLGTTFTWDAGSSDYLASERTDAPADGVRFVLYALESGTGIPAEPLSEIGYLDLHDLSTASADGARLVLVTDGVTHFDYRVTATGTESDGSANVLGFVSNGEQRIDFDLRNDITSTATSDHMVVDWGLEFPQLGLELGYAIDLLSDADGSESDWEMSLRGPNGYVDATGTTMYTATTNSEHFVFEVNGAEFAEYSCVTGEACGITRPDGSPLTADEADALEMLWSFGEAGAFLSANLMAPAGVYLPF
jgi:hypothetical protein